MGKVKKPAAIVFILHCVRYDLDLTVGGGSGLSLTAKIIASKMYAYIEKNASESTGRGCCADTLRVYDKFGETPTPCLPLPLCSPVRAAPRAHVPPPADGPSKFVRTHSMALA